MISYTNLTKINKKRQNGYGLRYLTMIKGSKVSEKPCNNS